MDFIRGTKPSGWQCNRLLDAVATVIKYKKNTIYHAIYNKVFSYGALYYIIVSPDDVTNTTNIETYFMNSEKSFYNNLIF